MVNVDVTDMTILIAFWLAFCRWSALLIQIPLFDNSAIPIMVKVLSMLVITYAFFPFVSSSIVLDINAVGQDSFWFLTIFNVVIGSVIGFLVKAIMGIFVAAGSVITQQIGFGAVRYFDPSSAQQVGPFEKLISWTILVMVISSGALIPIFKGGVYSFLNIRYVDLGKIVHTPEYFTNLFNSIFLSGILLASPIIFINILVMCILGVIARMVPQMNVLMVSFVINIGMGLLVFAAGSDEFFQVGFRIYTEKLGEWFKFIT